MRRNISPATARWRNKWRNNDDENNFWHENCEHCEQKQERRSANSMARKISKIYSVHWWWHTQKLLCMKKRPEWVEPKIARCASRLPHSSDYYSKFSLSETATMAAGARADILANHNLNVIFGLWTRGDLVSACFLSCTNRPKRKLLSSSVVAP